MDPPFRPAEIPPHPPRIIIIKNDDDNTVINILTNGYRSISWWNETKLFLDKGFRVLTIDNLSTGFRSKIPNSVELIEGDAGDENIIKKLFNYKIDGIIHIAGQSSGQISFEKPVYDLKTNALSTLLLLILI